MPLNTIKQDLASSLSSDVEDPFADALAWGIKYSVSAEAHVAFIFCFIHLLPTQWDCSLHYFCNVVGSCTL